MVIMKPSEALAVHRAELRQLASRHGLSRARQGSVLRGTDTDQSDLDLLVDPAESTGLLTLAAFKIEAEKLLGVPVSVLTPNALPPKFPERGLARGAAPMNHAERVGDYLGHIAEAITRATSYLQPLQDIEAFEKNPQDSGSMIC
jgi:uncharacterized protein